MPDLSPESGSGSPGRDALNGRRKFRPEAALAAAILAAILAIVALVPSGRVIGAASTDVMMQFLAWRAFAAHGILAGHWPLWNPYTYSGQPFLGGFQSAVLYPPNVVFLFLPLARAVNFSILLHLAILGWGMHRLARLRGLHPLAAWVCALLFPLCGAVFPHLYAGHLPNICSMAWTPWILAGLEDQLRNRGTRGLLMASAAACLQILAGHVQYVFYTAVAAVLLVLVSSVGDRSLRGRAPAAVAAAYAAAALLAAAQLLPGLASIGQGIRHSGLGLDFAGMFSLPVENLVTFVAPGFLGDLAGHPYWGRGYLWEMTVFVGVSGLLLAAIAAADRDHRRQALLDLGMAALLLFVALGRHTPLFGLLYDLVPGFDRFRGVSKFTFPALLFLVLAIGQGVDVLVRLRTPPPIVAYGALQAGLTAAVAGIALRVHPGLIAGFLSTSRDSGESYLPARIFSDPMFVRVTGLHAGHSLLGAAVVLVVAGACLLGARTRPSLRWALLALLPLEMIGFARSHFATADARRVLPSGLAEFVAAHPGDYRVLNPGGPNNGFFLGKPDIWGDDPGPLNRYAEFMAYSQGGNPDEVNQNIVFTRFPAVYTMLRFRYAFVPSPAGIRVAEQVAKPMPVAQLIPDYRVIPDRNAMLAALVDPSFDPRRMVLLESEPYPRPAPGGDAGTVRIMEATDQSLALEVNATRPTLLLITDLYSPNWRARPIGESAQGLYQILPANYVLRAIPLCAGRHRIMVEYVPGGFRLGIGVSALAWLAWLGIAFRPRGGTRPVQ